MIFQKTTMVNPTDEIRHEPMVMMGTDSALASMLGEILVGSAISTRWVLSGHLHFPERL